MVDTAGDRADEQRQAFQEFMLGGGNGSNKKKHQASPSPRTPSHSSPPLAAATSANKLLHSIRRKYSSALQSFYACFYRDWLDTDDQLCQCVGSISNLRERIFISSRALVIFARNDETHEKMPTWKQHGYRKHPQHGSLALTRDDLDMTLTDELLQHERMMTLARRLMATLNQEQEALGRRLDELLLLQHHEIRGNTIVSEEQMNEYATRVEGCQQIFVATSHELYRKQKLMQNLLESMLDSVMYRDAADTDVDGKGSPRRVARRCADSWLRLSPSSCLYPYRDLIRKLGIGN